MGVRKLSSEPDKSSSMRVVLLSTHVNYTSPTTLRHCQSLLCHTPALSILGPLSASQSVSNILNKSINGHLRHFCPRSIFIALAIHIYRDTPNFRPTPGNVQPHLLPAHLPLPALSFFAIHSSLCRSETEEPDHGVSARL